MSFLCFAGAEGWGCSLLWIMMIVIFFIAAMARKQLSELMDIEFSMIGAVILGEIMFIIMEFATHSHKWSILVAIVALLVGGFVGNMFFGDGGYE